MINLWNNLYSNKINDPIELLVYQTRLVGADDSLVIGGGGNTSIKTKEIDWRGDEIDVLRVKGTGVNLKDINQTSGMLIIDHLLYKPEGGALISVYDLSAQVTENNDSS